MLDIRKNQPGSAIRRAVVDRPHLVWRRGAGSRYNAGNGKSRRTDPTPSPRPVASIGWITSLVQRAEASQKRINFFLNTPADIVNNTEEKTPIRGTIKYTNVSFRYPETGIQALDNISFTLNEGETLGIFGKTGSGKSTLVNLLCRSYDADEGIISFDNKTIQELNLNNLRQEIGYIPQDGYLFSGTIKEMEELPSWLVKMGTSFVSRTVT